MDKINIDSLIDEYKEKHISISKLEKKYNIDRLALFSYFKKYGIKLENKDIKKLDNFLKDNPEYKNHLISII